MMRAALGLVVGISLTTTAVADEVLLKGGGMIVGIVREESDEEVKVEAHAGEITVPRDEVLEIKKGSCPLTEYYDRAEKLKDSKDADEILELARWAKSRGLGRVAKIDFKRVTKLDPDNDEARKELGYIKHEGEWLTKSQHMKATGHVKYRGKWIKKEEKEAILARKKQRDEARRQANLERRRREQARLAWENSLYERFSSQGRRESRGSAYGYFAYPEYDYYYPLFEGYYYPIYGDYSHPSFQQRRNYPPGYNVPSLPTPSPGGGGR